MGAKTRHAVAWKRGFTLLELLLVLVILGTMAAVIVPQIGPGMAGAKLAGAARSVIQASRYARTMALLHQSGTRLFLDPASGTIRVQASAGNEFVARQLEEIRLEEKEAREAGVDGDGDPEGGAGPAAMTNRAAVVTTAKAFAEEIDTEFKSEGVSFAFLGYTDTIDGPSPAEPPAGNGAPFSVSFRSNGTCRPFRIRVMSKDAPEDDFMDISVDVMGTGKIEGTGEER